MWIPVSYTHLPTGIQTSSAGATSVNVQWAKSEGAKYYQVYRSTNSTKDFRLLGVYDENTFSMKSRALLTNQTYYYKVRAYTVVNKKGIYSPFSNVVKGTPKLAAPTNVKASPNTSTTLKISWKLTDGATYYQVYRSTSKTGKYALLGVYNSTTTSSKMCIRDSVKPVDGSGGGGISVCNDEEAFLAAYERAKSYSPTGSVIIETYVISDEIGISYAIQNGKVYLTAMHDRYLRESDGNFMKLPLAYIYPSKHLQFYQETQNQKVVEMFESIGLQNGTLFIQGFATENECPFYEMGYRFNGAKQYNLLKEENGFSTMDMMIHHARCV